MARQTVFNNDTGLAARTKINANSQELYQGTHVHEAPAKSGAMHNDDELPLLDFAASFGLRKLTWASLKSALTGFFNSLYLTGDAGDARYAAQGHGHDLATEEAAGFLSAADKIKLDGLDPGAAATDDIHVAEAVHGAAVKAAPADADEFGVVDSEDAHALKRVTWAGLKGALGTAAMADAGDEAGCVVQLDELGRLPAVSGALLTGLSSSDHGMLEGLGDDDHPQYFNVSRGDDRYAGKDHGHDGANESVPGFLSADDKAKLNGIATGANAYTHPDHVGDVTSTGDGATQIALAAVTNAKLAPMTAGTIKGRRSSSGSGDPEDCTLSDVLDLVGSAEQGDLLYRGSTGWVRLPAGPDGHCLKSQGSGQNPVWAAMGGDGGGGSANWELLQTLDLNEDGPLGAMVFAGLGSFRKYLFEFEHLESTGYGYALILQMSSNNGLSWDNGASDYAWLRSQLGGYAEARNVSNECPVSGAVGNAEGKGLTGQMELYDPGSAVLRTCYSGTLFHADADSGYLQASYVAGRRNDPSAVNAVQFYFGTGDAVGGKVRLFGWHD